MREKFHLTFFQWNERKFCLTRFEILFLGFSDLENYILVSKIIFELTHWRVEVMQIFRNFCIFSILFLRYLLTLKLGKLHGMLLDRFFTCSSKISFSGYVLYRNIVTLWRLLISRAFRSRLGLDPGASLPEFMIKIFFLLQMVEFFLSSLFICFYTNIISLISK